MFREIISHDATKRDIVAQIGGTAIPATVAATSGAGGSPNLDGGLPDSTYGGTTALDGGAV